MHRSHRTSFACLAFLLLCMLTAWGCAGSRKGTRPSAGTRVDLPANLPAASPMGNGAGPVLGPASTLDDYLAYAALHNAGLRSAFLRWKAALERIPQVRSLPDPRFNYDYYIRNVETRVGPQRNRFRIAQTFPWMGKLALRGDRAAEEARSAEARYEAARLNLFYHVKEAYYEYAYLARAVAVTQENLDLLSFFEKIVRTKYVVGGPSQSSLLRIQVELGKLEDRLRSLRDLRIPVAAKLNAAMNRPSNAELPWPASIPRPEAAFSEEALIARLKQQNPELKADDFRIAAARLGVDLARKDYFPDLTFSVQWIDTGPAVNPDMDDSGRDPVLAGISLNLPLWYGKIAAGQREAAAKYESASRTRTQLENDLLYRLQLALFRFRDAQRRIDLYGESLIAKARQSFEVALQEFQSGSGSVLDAIDAQRTLLEFELQLERARADRAQRLAELEMLVGGTLAPGKQDASR